MSDTDVILIAGPTASGKSTLALSLAQRLDGIIVNADSMQVYCDLRILTARPMIEEEAQAPHRLYGHVDAAENYSVGRWCVDVAAVLTQAKQAKQPTILVGGTGLYFKALTQGLAAVPPIPEAVREAIRGRLAREGVDPLYEELARRDPVTAQRLMPKDRARITRALEVIESTGRSISDWHREGMPPVLGATRAVAVFLTRERGELYRRIDARFETMISAGALDEVRALKARNLNPSLPAMKAHGVPWLIRHLNGEISLADAIAGGQRDTRRYTKRQATWFRHQFPDWPWVEAENAESEVVRLINGGFSAQMGAVQT